MTTTAARMFQRRRTAAQWTSENPTLGAAEFGVEIDTGLVKVGNGSTVWTSLTYINDIAQLVADEPTEVDLVTVADVTTLTLTDLIARHALKYASGEYYFSHGSTGSAQALTQNLLMLCPVWLSAGTMDRLGVDVSTAVASTTIRLGVYTDNAGLPLSLIAETTAAASSATTGIKDQTISAVIPVNGRYWLAGVGQGGTGVSINAANSVANNPIPIPLGTTAPGGVTNFISRTVSGVTGALPSTITGLSATATQTRFRWHFRYA